VGWLITLSCRHQGPIIIHLYLGFRENFKNLISTCKLTKQGESNITFFHGHCIFNLLSNAGKIKIECWTKKDHCIQLEWVQSKLYE
jgi:hypothetical protein